MSTILKEYTKLDSNNKLRVFVDFVCDGCGKTHAKQKRQLKTTNYCSSSCAGDARKRSVKMTCDFCKSEYEVSYSHSKSKSGLHFCSRACKDQAQHIKHGFSAMHPDHYGTNTNYRFLAFSNHAHKCDVCGWNEIPDVLEVHHKDSNHSNNSLDNLQILCPTCHVVAHYKSKTGKYAYKNGGE